MYNLHKESIDNYNINTYLSQDLEIFSILYRDKQLAISNSWNGQAHSLFIFKTNKTPMLDNNNIKKSLLRIAEYIRCNKLVDNIKANILAITKFD